MQPVLNIYQHIHAGDLGECMDIGYPGMDSSSKSKGNENV